MGRIEAYQEFREWHDRQFPDGKGSALGGWYGEDDIHAAFTAGGRAGQEHPAPAPRMPPLPASARFDTAAALRLAGKRGEIHPADAAAFTYPDAVTFERYAASNRASGDVDVIGPLEYRGLVVGIVDVRRALPRVTDPGLSDDWPN